MSTRILTLPGIHGSGPGHWQTAWERSLPGVRRVAARDWAHPSRDDWVAALEQAVVEEGPDVLLVAHSLGCLQAVHWASQTHLTVRGALLVAPPDPSAPTFPSVAADFAPLPRARLPFTSIVVMSTDDPYGGATFVQRSASEWGSMLVAIGPCGHINAESGLGDWTDGVRILARLGD